MDHLQDSLLVASAAPSRIFVYSNEKLEWVCAVSSPPVVMQVNEFGGLKGLITCFDESGGLNVNYLGTDPPANVVAATGQYCHS